MHPFKIETVKLYQRKGHQFTEELIHPIYGGLVVGAWLPYIRDADARRRRKRHDTGHDRHKLGLHANARHLAPPPTPCLLTDLRFSESQTTKRLLA